MTKIISAFIIILSTSCDYCDYYNDFKRSEIKGIIIEKKEHKWNKNEKTILFENSLSEIDNIFLMPGSDSDIWQFSNVGDSIFKENNSTFVIVKRYEMIKKFNIKVKCP